MMCNVLMKGNIMKNRKYIWMTLCALWMTITPAFSVTVYEPGASAPSATMNGSIGASQQYLGNTSLPQSEITQPFAAGPRRSPGSGGTGKTDVDNPGLPIGDEMVPMLVMAVLCAGVVLLRRKLKIEK